MDIATCFRAQACNNAWANHRLLNACLALSEEELRARRTSFFPGIDLTLRHILAVDLFYVAALEGAGRPFQDIGPGDPPHDLPALQAAQQAVDFRLIAVCEAIDEEALDAPVVLPLEKGPQRETRGRVLLHLYQHQVHHRGQVHATLAGTRVAPPQLDEFFLADPAEAAGRAPEFAALWFTEASVWR